MSADREVPVGVRPLHRPAAISCAVCGLLVLVGAVRLMSYSRATPLGDLVRDSPLGLLGYDPGGYANAQFFKILATPTVVGLQYFLFRLLNRGHDRGAPDGVVHWRRTFDFRSPWLRLILTSLATAHWLLLELAKFSYAEDFYPYSPLESARLNLVVLLAGQLAAFLGMKHLSFAPLFRR